MKKYGVKPIWALFKFYSSHEWLIHVYYMFYFVLLLCLILFFFCFVLFLGVYCFNTVSVLLCCVFFFHSCFFRWNLCIYAAHQNSHQHYSSSTRTLMRSTDKTRIRYANIKFIISLCDDRLTRIQYDIEMETTNWQQRQQQYHYTGRSKWELLNSFTHFSWIICTECDNVIVVVCNFFVSVVYRFCFDLDNRIQS